VSFGVETYALALVAGLLTTLSPCVLPLVPVLMSSATAAHRLGPWALALGVALSYAVVGGLLASVGASFVPAGETFRAVAAALLIVFGSILASAHLQALFARATGRLATFGQGMLVGVQFEGWRGQFALGVLLGLVWTPCVGPTLGAAATLASQGRDRAEVCLLMVVFSIGASIPMLLLGLLSRVALQRTRGSLAAVGRGGKRLLGLALMVLGLLILGHLDRQLEAWLLDHSPAWLTALTTRY
jgi:cytochrome c-type biogenesis protein